MRFKVLILFAAACLVWTALLSGAFMWFTGTGISTGWIVAGAIFAALLVPIAMMAGEYHSAMDLAEGSQNACKIPATTAAAGDDSGLLKPSIRPHGASAGERELVTVRSKRALVSKLRDRRSLRPVAR